MARPRSDKVDYFPHYVHSGKTLFILESKYGNDGYCFCYRLSELLSDTEGHAYDAGTEEGQIYLEAHLRVGGREQEMLELLAAMGDIDAPLWRQQQIIWCQGLVNTFTEVYRKRGRPLPEKPRLPGEAGVIPISRTPEGVSGAETPAKEGVSGAEMHYRSKENKREVKPPLPPAKRGDDLGKSEKLNPRRTGSNPRATGGNPRAAEWRRPAGPSDAPGPIITPENVHEFADQQCSLCRGPDGRATGMRVEELRGKLLRVRCECVKAPP